jgi:large conductance mechanosensitive channel
MKNLIAEFREFIDKGNIVEAAVGLILALAFTPVVKSLVDDIVMQIVAAIFGEPNFGRLSFGLGDAEIFYGNFINTVISFVAIAFIVFMLVRAYNKSQRAETPAEPAADPGPSEKDLLVEIRDALTK